MATASAQERDLQAQNTYKDGKYRRWAWENPYCLWRQDPSRLIPNTQGCFLLNSYVSDSYALFRLIFTLLRTWASGTLKTWVDSCFYCSNGCRRAYFSFVDAVKRPHKAKHLLRTVFTPPLVFWVGTEQEEGLAWFVNESEIRGVTVGRRGLWHPLQALSSWCLAVYVQYLN